MLKLLILAFNSAQINIKWTFEQIAVVTATSDWRFIVCGLQMKLKAC
jgi:hypothetical protein